ncbi:plasminogen [Culex quinquefasciatus]|uniref:CLIP domain-containing serine protease n=1 Tax=Culex quinquefasciatus TaxID=7176 RepID=B0WSP1_CULQU|nr:plasminogen [Culex quinquefasciatus]|eukprot:XP_001870699.1 plasminogen [Culex quinquefasciatus]
MLFKTVRFATLVLAVTFVLLGFIPYGLSQALNKPCTNPRGEPGLCVFLRECRPLLDIFNTPDVSARESEFFYASRCSGNPGRKPLVCCAAAPSATSKELPRPPADCGLDSPDRIVGGTETTLGEFSWAALLVYKDRNGKEDYKCGATLINSRYVVTAAHCITMLSGGWTLNGVRLGEHNVTNKDQDCDEYSCADAPVEVGVEKVILHEGYNQHKRNNDIALIRLDRDVGFSTYINPICLPLEDSVRQMDHTGVKATAAGWGITESDRASEVKLKVTLDVVDLQTCRKTNIKYNKLDSTQLCAGGQEGEDTCRGDSGGPLMRQIQGNYHLIGVVSIGPIKCGTENVPGVYTNVATFIDWIQSKLE